MRLTSVKICGAVLLAVCVSGQTQVTAPPLPKGLAGPTGTKSAGKTIRPDGITKRVETHRVDLSQCSMVKIEGPVRDLDVSLGEYHMYWFKQYASLSRLDITCEMEVTP